MTTAVADKRQTDEVETASGRRIDKNQDKDQTSSVVVGQHEIDQDLEAMARRSQKHHKKWNRRMKIFFCCLGYKKNKVSVSNSNVITTQAYNLESN